jgi:adenine-specific DNA-methyltransferase
MNNLPGTSADILADNIEKIKQLFPEVFTEDKIDFELLQEVLGEYVEGKEERYRFEWNGKSKALRLSQTQSTGTLRPCKEESKDWDTTENLYIEGDNLEVLKMLQKTYHNRIKMIYIDPPYNTGGDFVYKDDFKDNIKNYLDITGQTDEEGKKLSTNSETSGRYHTEWLNMMYPRLRLAKNLLTDDGVIFISIDDNEVENLRKISNEIFGEENFIACIVWKRKRGRDNSAKWFSKSHEYLIVCAKNKSFFNTNYLELDEETKKAYKNPDSDSRGIYRMLAVWARGTQSGVEYDFTNKEGQYFKKRLWLFSKENLTKLDKENKLIIRGDNIYRKLFIFENKGKIPETLWDNVSNAANASDEIKRIFSNIIFDTPKPIPYIQQIINISSKKDDIILDFFSGSATTAHAIMKHNTEDGGNRKFIMVQLPEPTDEKSEAHNAGYKNICEIGKERIRRAGEKIKEELQGQQMKLGEEPKEVPDIGFKVFKLDSSNLKKWNPDFDDIEGSLMDMVSNYVDGRTEEDVLYEIMLKYGIDLTYPIETGTVDGKQVFNIGFGSLFVCLADDIDMDIAKYITQKRDELMPDDEDHRAQRNAVRVVFKDNGFKDDSTKTNVEMELERCGFEEVVSV